MVTGHYIAFSNSKKMATVLHREVERKFENVKHKKLKVMWSTTKNNMSFQPE